MQLKFSCILAICVWFAHAISDEDFQNFKTEVATQMVALRNQINDGLGQIQNLGSQLETMSLELNETQEALKIGTKEHENLKLEVKKLKLMSKLNGPETCMELAESGIDESMNVMLDPDGKNQGLAPIDVKCQLPEGKSILGREIAAVVDHCNTLGCYKKEISYDAPIQQIEALMAKSSTCSQTVKVECTSAPIVDLFQNENRMTWNDRHGSEHSLTVIGSNSCDERKPFLVTDTDEITDKEKLPILGITYGPLTHQAEKMTISIGPLVCEAAVDDQEYSVEEHVKELEVRVNDTIAKIDIEHKELRETLNQKMNRVPCPTSKANYHSIDNKCYYFDTTSRNYNNAKMNCNAIFMEQGKLFEPKSSSSNKKVHKVALSIQISNWWLGINDKSSEGSWVYDSNGASVAFSIQWYSGQPNGGSSENCPVYWSGDQKDIGQIGDTRCMDTYPSICEQIV